MKIEYLRHIYTWSSQCITGNRLGWGITASSVPKDKNVLREIEKLAQVMEPDRVDGVPVEAVVYSPVAGYVRMRVVPAPSGEDNRANKEIRILQPVHAKGGEIEACFLRPAEEKELWENDGWEPKDFSGELPIREIEGNLSSPHTIAKDLGIYDRLPALLRAVFLCLFEYRDGLNVTAPSWEKDEMAENASKFMYVVHSLLPEPLRKKAGYRSYAWQQGEGTAFYFSTRSCGAPSMSLPDCRLEKGEKEPEELEDYFYEGLAELYQNQPEAYREFMVKATDYLDTRNCTGNELCKLQWLFYDWMRQKGKKELSRKYLMEHLPELFYWYPKEPALRELTDSIVGWLHQENWTEEEIFCYVNALQEGVTKSSMERICQEMIWILTDLLSRNRKLAREVFAEIEHRGRALYGILLFSARKQTGTILAEIWEEKMGTLERIEEFLSVCPGTLPEECKDEIVQQGIGLLNRNLFLEENYFTFDRIMTALDRESQWITVLEDFVDQLTASKDKLKDDQLAVACSVERLLAHHVPKGEYMTLQKEWTCRQKGSSQEETEHKIMAPEERSNMEAEIRPIDVEEEEEGSFSDFILTGYPQGFLTGCILFVSHCSRMIGHWKIALGMGGMWLLLMLEYVLLLKHKATGRALWKNIGMCLVEGYLIELIASMFVPQPMRLWFFVILGAAALVIQIYNILRFGRED